jgi:hypothetical protein
MDDLTTLVNIAHTVLSSLHDRTGYQSGFADHFASEAVLGAMAAACRWSIQCQYDTMSYIQRFEGS